MTTTTAALTFTRQDGAFQFTDPAVPLDITVEEVTGRAVGPLRYPRQDIASGKALKYAMLSDGTEVRGDLTIGEAFPARQARVHIVSEFQNAGSRRG